MNGTGRRNFSKEYKEEAVKMVLEGGRSQAEVQVSLGIGSSTLSKWIREYRAQNTSPNEVTTNKRIRELEEENRMLKMEREILKKATAFFAKGMS